MRATAIRAAFEAACRAELAAPKPGNVHRFAAGHGMTAADFERSAAAAAPGLCRAGAGLGARVREAVIATRAALGQNTNLGIVLLCAPLAMAAERGGDTRATLHAVLAEADLADTEAIFRAITLAAPGGLGDAPRHDVRAPARVPILRAMAEAAARDSIARQWSSDFADIFTLGLPALTARWARQAGAYWPTLAVYFAFLARFPDSHILRKHGAAAAARVRATAALWQDRLARAAKPAELLPELLVWDAELKAGAINPGTSADLTVATLFIERLLELPH